MKIKKVYLKNSSHFKAEHCIKNIWVKELLRNPYYAKKTIILMKKTNLLWYVEQLKTLNVKPYNNLCDITWV